MMPRLQALKHEGFLLQEVTTGVLSTATNTNGVVGGVLVDGGRDIGIIEIFIKFVIYCKLYVFKIFYSRYPTLFIFNIRKIH